MLGPALEEAGGGVRWSCARCHAAAGSLLALPPPLPHVDVQPGDLLNLLLLLLLSSTADISTVTSSIGNNATHIGSAILLLAAAAANGETTETWRQYVPLAVICTVLLDIVLGSPIANLALAPMRRAATKDAEGAGAGGGADGSGGEGGMFGGGMGINSMVSGGGGGSGDIGNRKERVDTAAIAQTTLDKARGTVELMEYLEQNKSDEQRYDEIRKKLDVQDEMLRDKLDSLE